MASSTVGALNVIVGANVSRLQKKLKKARQSIGGFSSGIGRAGAKAAKFGSVGVAGATAALGTLGVKQAQVVTETQRVAERLGTSTKELSRLQFAARKTGVETETLNEGMQEMKLRLEEAAATGSGPAAEAISKLGLDAEKLASMDPARAFKEVSSAIKNSPDISNFSIDAIFGGSDGRKITNLINQGAAGINQLGKQADKAGQSFNKLEANKVRQASRTFQTLWENIKGIGTNLAIALAPAVTQAAGFMSRLVKVGRNAFNRITSTFMSFIQPLVSAFRKHWSSIQQTTIRGFQAIWGIAKTIGGLILKAWNGIMSLFGTSTSGTLSSVVKFFNRMRKGVALALNVVEFAIKNWKSVGKLALLTVAEAVITFKNQAVWVFTNVIPSTLKFLWRNWRSILKTVWDFTKTTISNLASNIVNLFTSIPELISGEKSFSDVWKPLTKGFENSVEDTIDIAKRKKGKLEKSLENNLAQTQEKVGKDLGKFLAKKRQEAEKGAKAINDTFSGISDTNAGLDDTGKKIGENMGQKVVEGMKPKNTGKKIGEEAGKQAAKTQQKQQAKELSLIRSGTAQARLAADRAGKKVAENLQREQVQQQKQSVKTEKQILRELKNNEGIAVG